MMKRAVAAILAAVIVTSMTGCGNSGGTESAAADATEQAAAETAATTEQAAAEDEWMSDPTAYLSGITASDYVDLPADYASLTVEVAPPAEVSDEDVEAMIDKQRQKRRELREVTKRTKVQEGDIVNIDYVGRINGEEFDGGSAEGYDLEIGSKSFIEGFEDGLIDQKVGDTVILELTFPENYGDSTKAGVDAEFEVTINYIQEYVVPPLTDQFAADLGITDEFGEAVNTVDDLRAYYRNYLIEDSEDQYTLRLNGAIRNALIEKSTFKKDLPPSMVKRENEAMISDLTSFAQENGVSLMQLMKLAYHSTEDSYMQDISDMAVDSVRKRIIIKAIGDKEGLSMTDEEFQAELETFVSEMGYSSVEEVPRINAEAYREALDKNKAMYFLRSKTTVVSPESEGGSTSDTAAPAAEAAQ